MLKTYRIIPLVFILFLFGFTLITVAPVLAEDSPEFVACNRINPEGYGTGLSRAVGGKDHATYVNAMKKQRDCFMSAQEPLNAKMAELETQVSAANAAQEPLNAKVAELETQVSAANAAQEPLNAKMAELEKKLHATTVNKDRRRKERDRVVIQLAAANAAQEPLNAKVAELETQLSVVNAAQEPLNAKVAELETQVSAANAAFLGCTKINPEGYGTGLSRAVGGKDHATYVKAMKKQRDCFMSAAGL